MATKRPGLKVAIVHDWLVSGGAEQVVLALHQMFPNAPIYTSYSTDEWRTKLDNKVITGMLQHLPFSTLRKFIPFLRIWWFLRLKFDGYDLVISSSGAEAKGIRVPKGTVHINYCHAPTHYYWSRYDEYMAHPGFGFFDPLARLGLRVLVGPLRSWDLQAAKRPDVMIANSTHIQRSIKKYYGRESSVIFPPVDIERFAQTGGTQRDGYVVAGRQTPYKRIDLAVQAATRLNVALKVIGRGSDHARLASMAGPSVTFLEHVSDAEMPKYFAGAKAFLFPGLDDFGIVAVEALAAGTPVIAYQAGGSLDYVEPHKTGIFFDEQTVDALCGALEEFEHASFDSTYIRQYAERFTPDMFTQKLTKLIKNVL